MDLANYCTELAEACGEAGKWVARNSDLVRNEQKGLLKELRRAGRLFRRCARSAGRKMCAGVFGPSQAGKSYLISALARDERNILTACFGSERHDFISEINPAGGKESTGLVTRFTMTRPKNLPANFPVQIRLLTETDLVKIIANTYYADCEHKEDAQSDIAATLESLRSRANKTNSHIDLDALEDIREYLLKDFKAKARVQELERSYWEQALKIGPQLAMEDRILLYALIWDEIDEFTILLRTLLSALKNLNYAEEAFCPLTALIPRQNSIIDVDTLKGLDGTAGSGDLLEVVTADGHRTTLPRAVVTALTAELTIVMEQKPADYFDYTDLLDFPGYRSRYKFDDVRRELKKEDMLRQMFLRGKVAYLFQRYCTERELTSMLLCIGPSTQEVQDLPGVINDWVLSTHGERPEDRLDKQISLFFILTKFDMEFEQKMGETSVEARWDTRLHASLLDFFGKQHDWPIDWDGQHAFNNLFLLRNPNYRFGSILQYEGNREVGVLPNMQQYVNKLETAFLQSKIVAAHFKDPHKAWNAAMQLNDGGISYIRESLSPLCNPELKRTQLLQSVQTARDGIRRRLQAFYRSDDKEEIRKQKALLIRNLYQRLGQLEKKQQRLGLLLRSFTLKDSEIVEIQPEAFNRFLMRSEEETAPEQLAPAPVENTDLLEIDLDAWNPFAEQADKDTLDAGQNADAIEDEADFFAGYIESSWVEKLHTLADNPVMQKYFMLPEADFSALVSELATGANRLGLRKKIAAGFRKANEYANTQGESTLWRKAGLAAYILNSYIVWLGFNPLQCTRSEREIRYGQNTSVIFEPLPPVQGFPILEESRNAYTFAWFSDWLKALYALIMDNINFDGEQTINVEENLLLGQILQHFARQ